ncbi:MAG: hypothetical protein LBE12_13195 [Planctomycetaceae bacterium]|nr:hypothetical protein [Planctomycetaceae bacterium]
MSQADYYQNGNHSACDTLNSPLSTTVCCPFRASGWAGKLKPAPLGRAIQ